ncbi:MAG: acyltransferase, partial [Verrucomicrobia bacterium]|nr:acyltransferase [Verrucomicrobiota bacterium]
MTKTIPFTPLNLQPRQRADAGVSGSATRILFIDNLRWTMIILVVSMHAADTYSPLGNWYFVDRRPLSTGSLLFFAAWQMYLQSFFMGLLFFVAGYFVPHSFDRKGATRFVRDRALRLGVPVLFYMFILGPAIEYFVAHSWTSTRPTSFVSEWLKHIRNGQFLQENGPLWFCLALLMFSLGYAILRGSNLNATRDVAEVREPGIPGTGSLVGFALTMAALTFMVRALHAPTLFNLPLRDFAQYALLFSAGILAYRNHWLSGISYVVGMRWLKVALSFGFAGWLSLLLYGGALHGRASTYSGGWHWQNAAFASWESLTCVALCYGLLVWFREKYNRQGVYER